MKIINGTLLTMNGKNYEKGYVEFEDGKITAYGDMSELNEIGSDVYDADSGYIMPGFIDAHTCIGLREQSGGNSGNDWNENTDPLTPHMRAIDGIYPKDAAFVSSIAAGVTSAVVAPGNMNIIGGQAALIKFRGNTVREMIVKAPCGIKMALGEEPKAAYSSKGCAPVTRVAEVAMLRDILTQAREYLKKRERGQNTYNPKLEALIPLLKGEIPAIIHAQRADDILVATSLAKEFDFKCIIAHGADSARAARYLKEENVPVILGPILLVNLRNENENASPKTAWALNQEGIMFAITTDHYYTPLEFLAVNAAVCIRYGLPEEEALKAITINAAIINGVDDRIGSIEIGKDADIVVFTGNPLRYQTKTSAVFIDGNRVF